MSYRTPNVTWGHFDPRARLQGEGEWPQPFRVHTVRSYILSYYEQSKYDFKLVFHWHELFISLIFLDMIHAVPRILQIRLSASSCCGRRPTHFNIMFNDPHIILILI